MDYLDGTTKQCNDSHSKQHTLAQGELPPSQPLPRETMNVESFLPTRQSAGGGRGSDGQMGGRHQYVFFFFDLYRKVNFQIAPAPTLNKSAGQLVSVSCAASCCTATLASRPAIAESWQHNYLLLAATCVITEYLPM